MSSQLSNAFVHRKPWNTQCISLLSCLCFCKISNWKGNGVNSHPSVWEWLRAPSSDWTQWYHAWQKWVNPALPWLPLVMGAPWKYFSLAGFLFFCLLVFHHAWYCWSHLNLAIQNFEDILLGLYLDLLINRYLNFRLCTATPLQACFVKVGVARYAGFRGRILQNLLEKESMHGSRLRLRGAGWWNL